jgi:hypothetical protein
LQRASACSLIDGCRDETMDCTEPVRCGSRYVRHLRTDVGRRATAGWLSRSCGNQTGCRPAGSWRAAPRNETVAPYFADILMTVVGVYGHTTLEMLSSGPFMLVKWPDGCCPKSRRWRPGDSRQRHTGDDKHVNFLWPAL